jgi:hypothetical protein
MREFMLRWFRNLRFEILGAMLYDWTSHGRFVLEGIPKGIWANTVKFRVSITESLAALINHHVSFNCLTYLET